MTPNNHDDITDSLGRALHDRADGVGAPLTLSDVKGRATRIRRRRAIAASAAVAAAVAIIVPTAIAGSDMFQDSTDSPPVATQNPTPDPTDTGGDAQSWPQTLDTSDLELGEAPKVTWFEGTTMHTPDGDVEMPAAYPQVVRYDDGYLAMDYSTGRLVRLDSEGQEQGSMPSQGPIATSTDGNHVLYVSDGRLVLHDNTTGDDTLIGNGHEYTEPVAVVDGIAYYNVGTDQFPADGRWWDDEEHDPTPDSRQPWNDVSDSGETLSHSSIDDFGSCSVLRSPVPDSEVLGETCDFTLEEFSPDGEHLIGAPRYRDGLGDGELAVLPTDGDAVENGEVVFHYLRTGDADPTFLDAVWEDDEHLLALTYVPTPGVNQSTWVILRLGLDGSVEQAVEPAVTRPAAEPSRNPFRLG